MWAWFLACEGDPKPTDPDDADQDGFSVAQGDCDDGDAAIHPEAVETCDGVDDDCDGVPDDGASGERPVFVDADADGFGDPSTATTPCAPPADAVFDGSDCDDADRDVFPGAEERCNGRDDDCDPATVDVAEVDGVVFFELSAAVAVTGNGGTLAVCDGAHDADGIRVTRDLTITSASGDRALATLASAGIEVTAGTLTLRAVTLAGAVDGAVRAAPGAAVVAEDVAFVGNAGRSGAALYGFDLTVRDSELTDNHATEHGGAVRVDAGGVLVIERTTFSANAADLDGGAVHATEAEVSLVDATFDGNSAVGSGGGAWISGSGGSVAISRSTFSGDVAFGEGGGLYVVGCSVLADDQTRFDDDYAAISGGGAAIRAQSFDVVWSGGVFTGNGASDYGGGMYAATGAAGSLVVRDAVFDANAAEDSGGGVFVSGGPVTLDGLTVVDNTSVWGGGTSLNWGPILVVGGVYERNVGEFGAATDVWDAEVVLQDTSMTDHAGGIGAVRVFAYAGLATLTAAGSTFAGNTPADVVVERLSGESTSWSGLGADFTCATDTLACAPSLGRAAGGHQ